MGGELPDGTVPHVVVDDVDVPILDDDGHHLRRVRRLRPGAAITVTDGRGQWRPAVLGSDSGAVEPAGEIATVDRPHPQLAIAFALTKGTKPDLVVQKLTELGIDRIVPFVAERTVLPWDSTKLASKHERWRVIARSAVEQSRRVWEPTIEVLAVFDDVVGHPYNAALVDRGGEPLTAADTALAVGPEGGWSDTERAAARRVSLGPAVLRAETAAIAAGVLADALRTNRYREL